MTEVNGPVGGPLVVEPQIAMFCGRQLLHLNTATGQWEPDPQGRQGCFTQPSKILSYCQEVQYCTLSLIIIGFNIMYYFPCYATTFMW